MTLWKRKIALAAGSSGNASRKKEELSTIFAKMEKVDEEATNRMKKLIASKRYLPVLVSGNAGEDLNQAFIFALREALHREKLEELAPESYYSEAVARIENWKKFILTPIID